SVSTGLVRAPRLSGRVSDRNGQPARAKLWVRAIPEVETIPNVTSYIDETDAQGRYEMNIPPGRYVVSIEDGTRPRVYGSAVVIEAPERMITVPADEDSVSLDLDFRTLAGNPRPVQDRNIVTVPDDLMGRIVLDDGSPLPVGTLRQFRVILSSDKASFSTQPFTNTQGIFRFITVPGEYV